MADAAHSTHVPSCRRVPPSIDTAHADSAPGVAQDRRVLAAAQVVHLPRRANASVAALRAMLADQAHRAIEALDALDAPGFDLEPDPDGEAEPIEASLHPATLAPNVVAFRRIRRAA